MSDEAYIFTEVYRVVFEVTNDYSAAMREAKTAVLAFRNTQGVK